VDKAIGYGIAAEQADGNDVIATYEATKRAVDRARRGDGVTLVELLTYRRKGHAEHDNQSYVPAGEIERWERENDPIARYVERLGAEGVTRDELAAIDARVSREIDEATDEAERSGVPEALDALVGVYADPPAERPLWFREGKADLVDVHERPQGWGTFDSPARGAD
jgi:TPP-dependent pyruvate/acetoin dehydrogenase alpha subunit